MSCYIVQEIDGVGRFEFEDGTGFLLLENCVPVPPGGDNPIGGKPKLLPRRRWERWEIDGEAEMLATILSEM